MVPNKRRELFIHRNRALPTAFGIECLKIQLQLVLTGESTQDSIRKSGRLRKMIKAYMTAQERKTTYLAVSPVLVNVFWASVSSPTNVLNQNKLHCIIPKIIKVLNCLKSEANMKRHIHDHWQLLHGLLGDNQRNIQAFIKKGGKRLIQKYHGQKMVKEYVDGIKEYCKGTVAPNLGTQLGAEEIVKDTLCSDEVDSSPVTGVSKPGGSQSTEMDCVSKVNQVQVRNHCEESKRIALEELDRIIARSKLRKAQYTLRHSVDLKMRETPKKVENTKTTPIKKFLSYLRMLPWRSE